MNFPKQQQSIDDLLIQMKMGTKQINRQANTSEKESNKYMKDAKNQLRKNNEEGAKMYLQTAASKKIQSGNLQKMGMRNEMMTSQLKTMQNNQQIMNSFNKMGQIANSMNPNFEQMAYNMNQFEEEMTKMTINQKMMQQMMGQQYSVNDPMADEMLNVLKQEIALEQKNKIQEAAQLKEKQRKLQEMKSRTNKLQF